MERAWKSLGKRTAVAGGAFVAFYALYHHVTPTSAALRGAGTWLVLLAAVRLAGWALGVAYRLDRAAGLGGAAPESQDDQRATPR